MFLLVYRSLRECWLIFTFRVLVVVKKELRGRGHGRRIMQAAEKQAAWLGCQTLHLSTHDQENFYRHLGYEDGFPISPLRKCVARLSMEEVH